MPLALPFWMTKLGQLWTTVRASHALPLEGEPRTPLEPKSGDTAITFIGHSSFLVQTAGRSVLIDPVFSTRLLLLRRARRAGTRVRELPAIHAVLLTHAHMDHLNPASLRAVVREMRRRGLPAPMAIVPRGVEDLVERLGFSRVEALDLWQASDALAPLRVTLTPARHWGARLFSDTHRQFGGYVLEDMDGHNPAVYHSGDTAYFAGFREIRERLHPEIALLPIGAYFPESYRRVHTSPEDALQAFVDVGSQTMVPMHFNTFPLGREPMSEPLPRLLAAAARAGLRDRILPLAEGETWLPAPRRR